jgi:nitroreductase
MDAIEMLLTRRSVSVKDMTGPAPDAAELDIILRAATRVPDHGKLAPWRVKILRAEGQKKLGELAAARFKAANPDANEKQLTHERERFARAPLCLAVLLTPVESIKAPLWEQQLSTGAVCTNILHAAHALGYGGKWLTEWVAYDTEILKALGGKDGDAIAGFIYLGTKTSVPEERERPNLEQIVSEWG